MKAVQKKIKEILSAAPEGLNKIYFEFALQSGNCYNSTDFERETRLVVNGDGSMSLFKRRSCGDSAIDPPGEFSDILPQQEIEGVFSTLISTDFSLEKFNPPFPGETIMELTVFADGVMERTTFSVRSPDDSQRIARFLNFVNSLMARNYARTVWNIRCEPVKINDSPQHIEFIVKFVNEGSSDILFVDPFSPEPVSPVLSFRFGERQRIEEGVTPLPIVVTTVSSISQYLLNTHCILLSPCKPYEFRAVFQAENLVVGNSIVQLAYSFYGLKDFIGNRRIFRGAVFSPEIAI